MTNIELAHSIIQQLVDIGVKEFILCAGARNSPFVQVMDANRHIKLWNFFEERSAGFFALGRIAATRTPVAVITTSGTAVAELLPAAIEGTYSSLPLIMITADRPKRFRGSGAPQSIDQVGIFSYYNEVSIDLDKENNHVSFHNLSWKKPFQVNVCFEEPLIDGPIPSIKVPEKTQWKKMPEQVPMNALDDIESFLQKYRPVVLVGYIPDRAQKTVVDFLKRQNLPVYAEGISGLRGHPDLKEVTLRAGERSVSALIEKGICDSILRLGGIPTARIWRDLEEKYKDLPILNISYNHYTGLSRESDHFICMEALSQVEAQAERPVDWPAIAFDQVRYEKMQVLFAKYPKAEPSLIRSLSRKLGSQSVYLGNSLPIRQWDLAADMMFKPLRVVGNRGANGIDGQISSFLGWSHLHSENWAIIGDLTAMYDLAALWAAQQMESEIDLKVVIVNNGGGQIFNRMFHQKEIYLNRHNISFDHWAKMWGWDYQQWEIVPDQISASKRQIVELIPDSIQTESFWNELGECWKE